MIDPRLILEEDLFYFKCRETNKPLPRVEPIPRVEPSTNNPWAHGLPMSFKPIGFMLFN